MAMGKKTLYLDRDLCKRLEHALKRVDADLSVSSVLNQYLGLVTPFYEDLAKGVELASPEVLLQAVKAATDQSHEAERAMYRSMLGIATQEELDLLASYAPVPPKAQEKE